MNVDEMMQGTRDALTVRKVYGEPIERGDVTVIPVAKTLGGSGGGSGQSANGDGGDGGGFGVRVKPVGVYVIQGGHVRWVPAVDPVRVLLVAGLTAVGVLGAIGRLTRARDDRAARVVKAVRIARRIAKAKARAVRR
ncbi:MAG: hypothetical protein KQH57_00875 [Actinomycetales bacterium]|nr:hypothetical protein [Actinomycetales bacterium]